MSSSETGEASKTEPRVSESWNQGWKRMILWAKHEERREKVESMWMGEVEVESGCTGRISAAERLPRSQHVCRLMTARPGCQADAEWEDAPGQVILSSRVARFDLEGTKYQIVSVNGQGGNALPCDVCLVDELL